MVAKKQNRNRTELNLTKQNKNNYSNSLSLQWLYTALNKLNKRNMTTNKRNQDRTGQLSTHNIFYQTVVAVTQFIQK